MLGRQHLTCILDGVLENGLKPDAELHVGLAGCRAMSPFASDASARG